MFQITSITSESRQKHKLPVDGYADCEMIIEWRDTQSGWFASFTWGTWSVTGVRLCVLPNILAQWSNTIPFGIIILSNSGQDPMTIDAFEKSEATMFVMTSEERAELEATYG